MQLQHMMAVKRHRWMASAAAIAILLLLYLWRYEYINGLGVVLAYAITIGLAAVAATISGRLTFSLFFVAALATAVVLVSVAKLHFMALALHAYDIVIYLGSGSTLKFLVWNFPLPVAGVSLAVLALGAACALVYRHDPLRIDRRMSLAAVLICAIAAVSSYESGHPSTPAYFSGRAPLSVFYDSIPGTLQTIYSGAAIEATAGKTKTLFNADYKCSLQRRPPHIILVHEESMFPPELFPSIVHDYRLDSFFRSFDDKLHKLNVEIYGGGSWLTEFSLVTGLSSRSFGGMRSFVGPLMKGKVHDALPQALKSCGYRNALFYPMDKEFVGDGEFFESVGVDDILDKKAQKAITFRERDRFYFANALDYLQRQLAGPEIKPLFVYVQLMSGHYPYDNRLSPTEPTPENPTTLSADFNEYLRRQWFAKMDYEAMKSELKARFPNEPFLIVHYGDHQPRITKELPEIASQPPNSFWFGRQERIYQTYYAIDGVNYEPPPLPEYDSLDIAFLGAVLMREAGLPLPDSFKERLRIARVCGGRYFDCPYRNVVLNFHRKLIDSGLIVAR